MGLPSWQFQTERGEIILDPDTSDTIPGLIQDFIFRPYGNRQIGMVSQRLRTAL